MTDPTAAPATPTDQPFPTYEPPTGDTGAGSEPAAPAQPRLRPHRPLPSRAWLRPVG